MATQKKNTGKKSIEWKFGHFSDARYDWCLSNWQKQREKAQFMNIKNIKSISIDFMAFIQIINKEILERVLIKSGKTFLKICEEKWFTQKWRSMNTITIVEAELGWLSQQRNIQSKMHSG